MAFGDWNKAQSIMLSMDSIEDRMIRKQNEANIRLSKILDRLNSLDAKLHHTAYGPWKVIHTSKHADGTIIETAQRIVVKTKEK